MTCIKCGKPATKRFSPDLDIEGMGACDEHAHELQMDLIISTIEGWEWFEKKYFKKKKNGK